VVWSAQQHIGGGHVDDDFAGGDRAKLQTRGHICLIPLLALQWAYFKPGKAIQT